MLSQNPGTRLHLGQLIENEPKDPLKTTTKLFLDSPSRVHAAMHYILLLEKTDFEGQDSVHIWEEMLPILYELLSADASAHIGMGATALIHLLSLSQSHNTNTLNAKNSGFPFAKLAGTLLPVLDMACQVCRKGQPYALIAQAQSLLCEVFTQGDAAENITKHRRKKTRYFFTVLDKHSHKVSDPDGLLWALLVGGILPLLYQHATESDAISNVDAMEIGRLGLSALLPIVQYSSGWDVGSDNNTTRKMLAPSVLALVYLLNVAYPIMLGHGGKIMSELLALLGNLLQHRKLRGAGDLELLK